MKATWLGGSGLLFENGKVRIFTDPVFGDAKGGRARVIPSANSYAEYSPSLVIVTHAHPESLDTDSLDLLLGNKEECITVLASESAYNIISERYPEHNPVLLSPHSVWNEKGITFYAVKAPPFLTLTLFPPPPTRACVARVAAW